MTRLPAGPLLAYIAGRPMRDVGAALWPGLPFDAARQRLLRLNTGRKQGLTVWEADELAARLGLHPAEVWGAAWWQADDEGKVTA